MDSKFTLIPVCLHRDRSEDNKTEKIKKRIVKAIWIESIWEESRYKYIKYIKMTNGQRHKL